MVASQDERVLLSVFNYGIRSLLSEKSCKVGAVLLGVP